MVVFVVCDLSIDWLLMLSFLFLRIIVHHVCGEHEWNEGVCSHGPLTEVEGGKEYLDMDSKAAKELKKIVLDLEWLKSLQLYVFFRQGLESYSIILSSFLDMNTFITIFGFEMVVQLHV